VTTVQLEMNYLTHSTGEQKYQAAGDKALQAVLKAAGSRGLVPVFLKHEKDPKFVGGKLSLGAMGDSYYEYLLKQWIQTGKQDTRLKDKWKKAMKEMMDGLVQETEGGLTYVAEKDNGHLKHRMDHLACFVGGMLMLGARSLPADEVDPRWEDVAAGIAQTCYEMYRRSPTGLAPEYVNFLPQNKKPTDMSIPKDGAYNILRPEAIETLFYMHYYTGDPKYRDWAAEMFRAFVKHTKAKYGFSAVRDVMRDPPDKSDSMESFFLAETLKYFFLIFSPRDKISLEEFVFNTEAHPLRVWQ